MSPYLKVYHKKMRLLNICKLLVLSFPWRLGLCTNSLSHWLAGGIQGQGMRRRTMQAWVSCSGDRTTSCEPHALGGDQCGEQRGPDLQHSIKTTCKLLVWSLFLSLVPKRFRLFDECSMRLACSCASSSGLWHNRTQFGILFLTGHFQSLLQAQKPKNGGYAFGVEEARGSEWAKLLSLFSHQRR